ncbi:MAG: hypothetical protein QNJ94_18525 [Alphaproteobacteria bacterium]|nr:hypothetical protein [Alphaproteobacteria bacterium]
MTKFHMNVARGEDPSAHDVATDATSLGTGHGMRVIIDDAEFTRDEAAEALEAVRHEILHGRRAWPLAT